LNAEYKAKNKMLKDVEGKISDLDGPMEMANSIEQLQKLNKELESQLKNKGASQVELQQAKDDLQDLQVAHRREIQQLKEQNQETEERLKEKCSKVINERDTFKKLLGNNTVELENLKTVLTATQQKLEEASEEWEEKVRIEKARAKDAIK